MSNNNLITPYGLAPIRNQFGSVKVTAYYIPNNLAQLAIGTVMTWGGSSNSNSIINGKEWPAGSLASVAVATGGDQNAILGPIIAFEQVPSNIMPSNGSTNPANTENVCYIADDINQEFTIIANGSLVAADMGKNANLTIGTVNGVGIDSTSLNVSTATTSTYQLKIEQLNNAPNNVLSAANPEVIVKINNHCLANVTAGV